MNLREITIGRAKNSDIYLDPRCQYASSYHATIYMDGNQLMFKDMSTNGTMINNVSVRHRAVPIHQGDIIMLAGQYQISWNQINTFFPQSQQFFSNEIDFNRNQTTSGDVPAARIPDYDKWTWGAFTFTWIWGLFNGCWWMFLIQLALIVFCFVPYMNLFMPIVYFIIYIVYGVNGRKWAWENRSWRDADDFERTQDSWNTWGLIFFIIGIVLTIVLVVVFYAAIFTYIANNF